eukprot:1158599-Prymnesium_polylepis.2
MLWCACACGAPVVRTVAWAWAWGMGLRRRLLTDGVDEHAERREAPERGVIVDEVEQKDDNRARAV